MDEFDMSNLDSFDFEAAEKSAKENSDKKAAEEADNISELREGANDCIGGSCTI